MTTQTCPIYMYHQVAPDSTPGYTPYLYQTPEALRQQIRSLRTWGYTFCTVRELFKTEGRRRVALTFDDAGELALRHALPVLTSEGVTATFFVIAGDLAGAPVANRDEHFQPLNRDGLQALAAASMEIGSHSLSHRELTSLEPHQLERDLTESRSILEACLNQEIQGLCYPRGRTSTRVAEAARQAGYRYACSTFRGNRQDDLFSLKRIRAHQRRQGLRLWYTTTRLYEWWNRKRLQKDRQAFAAGDAHLNT